MIGLLSEKGGWSSAGCFEICPFSSKRQTGDMQTPVTNKKAGDICNKQRTRLFGLISY